MNDVETEIFLEGFEVTVPVEKGMALDQTKSCNQAIDRLPNRTAMRSKGAVILCRGYGQILASRGKYLEPRQLTLDTSEVRISVNSLQDFTQNEIGQSKAPLMEFSVQPLRLWICCSRQVIDPDSCIYDRHYQFSLERGPGETRSDLRATLLCRVAGGCLFAHGFPPTGEARLLRPPFWCARRCCARI